MGEEKQPDPGFGKLPCPRCGDDCAVWLALDDLSLRCHECDAEFDVGVVRDFINRWAPVLVWLDSAPRLNFD